MTGFGSATGQDGRFTATVELKAVNNRYLKLALKLPEVLSALEPNFERTIRDVIGRGTVTVNVRFSPIGQASRYRIATDVIREYWLELTELGREINLPVQDIGQGLLALPGVVADELDSTISAEAEWPFLKGLLDAALEKLHSFRRKEGEAMSHELAQNCDLIGNRLAQVSERAPRVVETYRDKILDRINELLRTGGATVTPQDLIREVSIFADRCDINEEITRLRCHLVQFGKVMADPSSQGRKLDFLSQEMFREVNTIGSKANDVEIAHHVVEMKTAVERVREILQNVE